MNTLAINAMGAELAQTADVCRSENLGLEITDLAFPQNLDADPAPLIARHRKATRGIRPLSSHGPFFDLIANSFDPLIVDVTRRRHQAALEASHAIGASLYVAHTNFNPQIRGKAYREGFYKRMRDFWLPFADWAAERSMIICLENLWEPDASIQAELVATIAHPSLQASFDNGHALVFSRDSAAAWIQTLGAGLAHCHLHDNQGALDEHAIIGTGKEDWPGLLHATRTFAPQALLVIECDRLDKNLPSLEKVRSILSRA